ncbi:hypothetical protein RJ639_035992 [Escallonia herrerae]|uniref:FAR1 domain-containing protein n=1 Tax=Escallonia herrerae TaxID=1293975 RepID=A0AA88WW90_9ASTE|nr:hypothetical protein RJ639_035992 [Escallonia herrerae]
MRDGKVVWRRLVCNKEGFRKCKPRRSENKAMIVVKKEKTGKWVVTRFVTEHNHPLIVGPPNNRLTVLLSQTPVNSFHDSVTWSTLRLSSGDARQGGKSYWSLQSSRNVNQYLASFSLLPPLYKFQDEKDVKIRELTAELQRERERSAAIQEQLDMVLKDMEEHSNHLSRNIDDIVQSVKEIESKRIGR